jgi:hypothetical protein
VFAPTPINARDSMIFWPDMAAKPTTVDLNDPPPCFPRSNGAVDLQRQAGRSAPLMASRLLKKFRQVPPRHGRAMRRHMLRLFKVMGNFEAGRIGFPPQAGRK